MIRSSLVRLALVGLFVGLSAGRAPVALARSSLGPEPFEAATAPQVPWLCGNMYFCCYEMRCDNGVKEDTRNYEICPKAWGRENSRAGAWDVWNGLVVLMVRDLHKKHTGCYMRAASCYDESTPYCHNYPN